MFIAALVLLPLAIGLVISARLVIAQVGDLGSPSEFGDGFRDRGTDRGTLRRSEMANPWLKKNPFMSMWLSTANRVAGTLRAQATAQVKRQAKAVIAEALSPPAPKAKPRRKP